jgi:hypothetical protein
MLSFSSGVSNVRVDANDKEIKTLIYPRWNRHPRTKLICSSTAAHSVRAIRVLTSGNDGIGHLDTKPPDTPEQLKYEHGTTLAQARWLTLSSNSKQIFARVLACKASLSPALILSLLRNTAQKRNHYRFNVDRRPKDWARLLRSH